MARRYQVGLLTFIKTSLTMYIICQPRPWCLEGGCPPQAEGEESSLLSGPPRSAQPLLPSPGAAAADTGGRRTQPCHLL